MQPGRVAIRSNAGLTRGAVGGLGAVRWASRPSPAPPMPPWADNEAWEHSGRCLMQWGEIAARALPPAGRGGHRGQSLLGFRPDGAFGEKAPPPIPMPVQISPIFRQVYI
jgi:hypothetical protein